MNEKMNQIIDEVHRHYLEETMFSSDPTWLEPVKCMNTATGEISTGARQYAREAFVSKIKSDTTFSDHWRLKIEERELVIEERFNWLKKYSKMVLPVRELDKEFSIDGFFEPYGVPSKIITVTYKEEKFEFYEN